MEPAVNIEQANDLLSLAGNRVRRLRDERVVLLVVSSNGDIYTLTGSKEDIKTQYAQNKEKNQVNGKVSGNQRAWRINVSLSDSGELEYS